MAERQALNQTIDIKRKSSSGCAFVLRAQFEVYYQNEVLEGRLEEMVESTLLNFSDKHEPPIAFSRSSLTADVVADVIEAMKKRIAKYPDAYIDRIDEPIDISPADVRLETAQIFERKRARRIDAVRDT